MNGKSLVNPQIAIEELEDIDGIVREELKSKVEVRTKELVKECDYVRHMIDASPDFQLILDKEGTIMDLNKAFETIVGRSREDVIGTSIYEYLPHDATERAIAGILEKKKALNIELPVDIPEKGVLIWNIAGTVFTTWKGEEDVYITARDMTEQRANEMQQLIHAGRLSTLGEMATGVAHEITQPLYIISLTAEGVLRDVEKNRFDASMLPDMLKGILKNVKRINRIITHMRTFARQPERWEDVEPEEVLNDAFVMLDEQLKLHVISVSREVKANLPLIKVDKNQLEQVFINILVNARQALHDKEWELAREGKSFEKQLICRIFRLSEKENDWVVFEFADNAYGVPDELKMRVFDPFFTTKEVGQGTGLGLSLAHNIVTRLLSGKIWVEDNEMGGASFKVAIPIENRE